MDSSFRLTDEAVVGAGPGLGASLPSDCWQLVGSMETCGCWDARKSQLKGCEGWRGRTSGDYTRLSLPPHLKCTSKTRQRQITAFISKSSNDTLVWKWWLISVPQQNPSHPRFLSWFCFHCNKMFVVFTDFLFFCRLCFVIYSFQHCWGVCKQQLVWWLGKMVEEGSKLTGILQWKQQICRQTKWLSEQVNSDGVSECLWQGESSKGLRHWSGKWPGNAIYVQLFQAGKKTSVQNFWWRSAKCTFGQMV